VIVGNVYDKYGTRNPVARALMRGFLGAVTTMYRQVSPESVLEIGCGEGLLAHHLLTNGPRPRRFVASDRDLRAAVPGLDPLIEFLEASAYDLPFPSGSFDLVVCCEVLEHLHDPPRALSEAARVARRAVIVSTPREPLWRLLNIARGAYIRDLGNTPGHVQHFGSGDLERLVARQLHVLARRSPLPWTVLLGKPHGAAPC
jgi:ubiquinone/menaquinone biosynthesis C-methylase UbiE